MCNTCIHITSSGCAIHHNAFTCKGPYKKLPDTVYTYVLKYQLYNENTIRKYTLVCDANKLNEELAILREAGATILSKKKIDMKGNQNL